MSYATQVLKRALLYDEGAETLYLSPHIPGLGAARDVLLAAFGNNDVFLKQVQEVNQKVNPPANAPEGVDLLCLFGKGDIFNYPELEVYLEFGLRDANLLTMLILVSLPEQWNVQTVFEKFPSDLLPAEGALTQATIVISYGLAAIPDNQIVNEYDRRNPNAVDIARYPLQNGFQILAANVARAGGAVDEQVLAEAKAVGIPQNHLPEPHTLPNRVELRADVSAGWLVLERWWGELRQASSLAENVYPVGLAYRYSLTDPADFYHYWLLEVGAQDQPIVLEARVLDMGIVGQPNAFFPVRYTSRFATRTPLKQADQALAALLGEQASIFAAQGLSLPDDITMLGFSYAPGESLQCTFAAGDSTSQDAYLLPAGPLDLREIDFTVWAPIGKPGASASIELEATTSFFDEQFRVRVQPWTFIEGGLDDPDGVDLGGLVGKLLPAPLPFGLDSVQLTQAWVSHSMSSREGEESSTSLHLRLDGKVDLLPGAIELQEISIFFSAESDGSKDASLSAQFRMGSSIEMFALAGYEQGGWVFSGEVHGNDDGEGIHIREMINQLAQLLGATLPAEDAVPDVSLESFSLEYETLSRTLTIQAVTDWKIPEDIPVLAETDNRVLLQLTTVQASQQGKSETALSIEWTLKKGDYELDANVTVSRDIQTYSVDFSVPEPTQPVTLTDLTDAIGLPDIPKPAAGVLDTVFAVSHLALDYDRTGRSFSVSWARPLGKGIFLTEYSQSNTIQPTQASGSQSGGTNRFVEVSWLGNDQESTLGLDEVLNLVGMGHLKDNLKMFGGGEAEKIFSAIDELLTFKQLGFTWQENDKQSILLFTALSNYRQAKAFVAVRSGENEGLVAGIAFAGSDDDSTDPKPEPLAFLPAPVNKFLAVVEEVLEHIELTHFLFSTVSSTAYQPPAFAASAMQPSYARQDAGAPSYPFGAGTMALGQGVSVGARVKFGKHDIVRRVIDVDELDGQVTLGDVIALQVSIPGSLKLNAGGGNSLVLTSPMLRIKENLEIPEAGPEFDIMGGLDIQFFRQRLQMTGWTALAEESLTGHVQMTELALPVPLTPIYMLPGVQLVINKDKPLSLDLGLQFEPSGLDLGLSGSFAIYKDDKDLVYGDAAFVLELVEEIPQPLYVEFGTDELSIPVLLEAVTGVQYRLHLADSAAKLVAQGAEAAEGAADDVADQVGDAGTAIKATAEAADKAAKSVSSAVEAAESALGHLEAILSKVELRDVRFHWADSIVNLPDGATVMPGVGIRGGLRIFDWDAFAVLDISAQGIPGFSGHLEAEKIEIGRVLKIWGDGQGIDKTPTTAEDFNQRVKSKVGASAAGQKMPATLPPARDEGDWFLKPGGPVLHLSTRSAPFLYADLHAQLFGFLQTDIHADITEEGFDFDFKIAAGNAVSAELECHWWHKEGKLEAHGDLGIHLHGDIGPIIPDVAATQFHLDTDLDAHVSLMVNSEQFKLTVNGSFSYQGASLNLPELVLEEQFSTLEELSKKVWDHVVDEAATIFEQYLAPIGKFVEDGAKEVAQLAVAGADEVAHVASAAASEAKQIVSGVADTMDKTADVIGQDAKNLAGEAENVAKNAGQEALDAAAPLLDKVADLGQKALHFAADAAASVKAIVEHAVAIVSEAVHYAIQVAEQAAHWVAAKLDEARRWAAARLDQAKAMVNQLAQEAEAAVWAIEADIEEIESQIEELFSRAAQEVGHVLSIGWHAAPSWT